MNLGRYGHPFGLAAGLPGKSPGLPRARVRPCGRQRPAGPHFRELRERRPLLRSFPQNPRSRARSALTMTGLPAAVGGGTIMAPSPQNGFRRRRAGFRRAFRPDHVEERFATSLHHEGERSAMGTTRGLAFVGGPKGPPLHRSASFVSTTPRTGPDDRDSMSTARDATRLKP